MTCGHAGTSCTPQGPRLRAAGPEVVTGVPSKAVGPRSWWGQPGGGSSVPRSPLWPWSLCRGRAGPAPEPQARLSPLPSLPSLLRHPGRQPRGLPGLVDRRRLGSQLRPGPALAAALLPVRLRVLVPARLQGLPVSAAAAPTRDPRLVPQCRAGTRPSRPCGRQVPSGAASCWGALHLSRGSPASQSSVLRAFTLSSRTVHHPEAAPSPSAVTPPLLKPLTPSLPPRLWTRPSWTRHAPRGLSAACSGAVHVVVVSAPPRSTATLRGSPACRQALTPAGPPLRRLGPHGP